MISQASRALRLQPMRDMRKVDRDQVDVRTVMRRLRGREYDARIVNLSTHGFMVRVEQPFEPGEQVIISLPEIGEVMARVAWSLGGRTGGQFLVPIRPDRYAELLKEAQRPRPLWSV